MKKIGIDIRTTYGQKTGKGYYTFNLVKDLITSDQHNTYYLFSKNQNPPFPLPKNAQLVPISAPSLLWHFSAIRKIKQLKLDLFWAPTSYIIPALAPKKLKTIITVHDLVAILFPENHNKKANFIEQRTLKKALSKASHIFAVSNHTKQDLVKNFAIPQQKISITHCAASQQFQRLQHLAKTISKINSISLAPSFVLAVGTIQPRKNLRNIIKAFKVLQQKNPQLHLYIAGGSGWQTEHIYQEAAAVPNVNFLGYVSDQELVALYNKATVFLFPSLYEGFGIPVLEAMKCGCPVVTSNISSLPEVAGKAALLADPKSIDDIVNKTQQIIDNQDLRQELTSSGLLQANKFSWKAVAEQIKHKFNSFN